MTWLRTVKKFLLRWTASYNAKRTASLVLTNGDKYNIVKVSWYLDQAEWIQAWPASLGWVLGQDTAPSWTLGHSYHTQVKTYSMKICHQTCSQRRIFALGDSFLYSSTWVHARQNNNTFICQSISDNSCIPETLRSLRLSNKHASNLYSIINV